MKFRIKHIFLTLVLTVSFLSSSFSFAQTPENRKLDYQQVTTHPDIDLSARISPDGKWMAYVSRQSDNFDIWIRSTAGGRSIQVTFHKADDYYPVWYPDSRTIVFVSQRSDAAGDIWMVHLREIKGRLYPKGDPERFTDYMGYDGYPTVSPDSKKICWVSDRSGSEELWFYNEHTDVKLQLTYKGGTHPMWSSDLQMIAFTSFRDGPENNGDIFIINLKGPKPTGQDTLLWDPREYPTYQLTKGPAIDGFPSWTKEATQVVFLRNEFDTNKDGSLTPTDRAAVWEAQIFKSPIELMFVSDPMLQVLSESFNLKMASYAMPLTSGGEQVMQPYTGSNDRIYFTSDRGGNLDIWSFPSTGYIPRVDNPSAQYQLADSIYAQSPEMTRLTLGPLFLDWDPQSMTKQQRLLLWDRQLAFKRVIDYFGTATDVSPQTLYEIAVCFKLLDYPEQANLYLEILLKNFPERKTLAAYAEMLKLGLKARDVRSGQKRLELLKPELDAILEKYKQEAEPMSAAYIVLGDLFYQIKQDAQAFKAYEQVLETFPDQNFYCAEAQLKIGDVFNRFATQDEVIQAYLQVVQKYPEQRDWMVPARDRILDLLVTDANNELDLISRYREIVGQYAQFPLLAAAAQLRIGKILFNAGDYASAIQEYEMVESLFGDLVEEVFTANLSIAESLLMMGENLRAFSLLEQLVNRYNSNRKDLSEIAWNRLLKALLDSGDELKSAQEFSLALLRYQRAKEMDTTNLHAHRGYIECLYYLRKIDDAVTEYEQLVKDYPEQQVILYCLGLTYSYKGTEKAELYNEPDALDTRMLNQSSYRIARALALDYTMVQPYLTLSYNYEMMEQAEARERAKPKPFYIRLWNTLRTPFDYVYDIVTFAKVEPKRGYYERAIHELTKAIGLNDAEVDPDLEANLALNLANNYYNLGEYGYAKAYEYYHIKLKYDSTFYDKQREALIYERMGHCSYKVEDVVGGEKYLLRAIQLYTELEDEGHVLLNLSRLALLYQDTGLSEFAVEYFQKVADIYKRKNMYDNLMRSYRSIALNYLILEEPQDAIYYAKQALELLQSGKVKEIKQDPSRVKVGLLGLHVPVPFVNLNNMLPMAALRFTTEDESALVYTILGSSYSYEKNYKEAITNLDKKMVLFKKQDDKASQATLLNNIGYLYFLNGDYENAWGSFSESLKLCKDKKLLRGILLNSSNLARIVMAMNAAILEDQLDYTQVKDQFLQYQNDAAENINDALDRIQDEEFRYVKIKIEMYRYLADFSLIHFDEQEDLKSDIESNLFIFENGTYAQTYLEEALRTAKAYELLEEECSIEYDLGKLFYKLGNADESYAHLQNARRMAIRNAYYDMLWRIDTHMGDLLSMMPRDVKVKYSIQKDPYEYFIEAIDVLQAHPAKITGANAATLRTTYQKPYRRVIRYMVEKNDLNGALAMSEQMRAKLYLDMVSSENIDLRKERHKIYYGNAKFLQRTINELEISLLQMRNRFDIPYADIIEKRKELDSYKQEYETLLSDARLEVPELETLVRVNPVTCEMLQKKIRPGEALLYFTELEDQLLTWLVTKNQINYIGYQLSRHELNRFADQVFTAFKTGVDEIPDLSGINLFAVLDQAQSPVKHLVVVPPNELLLLPWSAMLYRNYPDDMDITTSTSLTDYYYSYDRRKIQGQRIFFASRDLSSQVLKDEGYTVILPMTSQEQNSFSAQGQPLGRSDVIYLQVQGEWNEIDPARSRMGFRIKQSSLAVFSSIDLYAMNLNAGLVQLSFEHDIPFRKFSQPFIAWERAFGYAGVPSMLVSLWPLPPESEKEFLSVYYKFLQDFPAAEALNMTRNHYAQADSSFRFWAGYQLYGFGGMSRDEEEQYAQEGFEGQVRRGHSAYELGEWEDAIRMYESAQRMAERQNDSESIELLQQRILECAVNGGFWSKAIETQLTQIENAQATNDVAAEANGYSNLAFFYTQNKEFDKGIEAKARFTRLAEQYGLKEEEAHSLRETGLIYERGGQYKLALSLFTEALDKFRSIENREGEAQCLRDVGRVNFFYLDNYYDALVVQRQALDIFKTLGITPDFVDALHNLGNTNEKMANYKRALAYQQQALEYAVQLDDVRLQGLSRQYLANVFWKMGSYQSALEQQEQALAIFESLQDNKLLQVANATRGLIALSFGDPEKAQTFELKALELATALGDRKDEATIYKNIGMIQRAQGRDDLALSSFEQAAEIDSLINSKRGMAYDLRNIASIQIGMGVNSPSRQHLNRSLQISQDIQDWRNTTQCYLELGRLEMLDVRPDSARVFFGKSAELAENLYMPEIQWRAHKYLAETWQGVNADSVSAQYYKAIDVIESMRAMIKVEEFASGFVDDKLDVYGALIDLHLEQGQVEQAFDLVERSKSRSFLDMLGSKEIAFNTQNRDLLAKEDSLDTKLKETQTRLFYLRSKNDSLAQDEMNQLEDLVKQIEQERDSLLVRLQQSDPELSDMLSVNPLTVEQLKEKLPARVGILEFYLYKDHLYSWLLTRVGIDYRKIEIDPEQFEKDVFELRQVLDRQLSVSNWSQSLYEKLIGPWDTELYKTDHLVLVPQGSLHYLPFAVLQNKDQVYFGLSHSLSIAPSATVMAYCLDKGDSLHITNRDSMSVLAFGNPDLGSKKWDLPFASREVNSLNRYFTHVNMLLNKRATETNLYSFSEYPPIMVFSCHGEYDDANPLLSALLLSPDSTNDGKLEAEEIFSLDLNAYIVAMSACETGLGTIRGGDEVVGLSRSFIYAGTSSLLSSLWKVDDLATAVLVKRFFRYLSEGKSRADALRMAQKIVHDEINPYPSFWAAFTLTGDWR